MTTLAELADYVRAVHDETLSAQEGMVFMIWQDFEITSQKSGELLWKRGMHTIYYGITGVNHEMPVPDGKNSFAYVPENTIEYIKTTLANIKKQEEPTREAFLDLPEIIEKYKLELRTEGTKAIIRVPDETMVPPYIKGLIFDRKNYNVVCPGVIMPEDITTPEQFDYEAGAVETIEAAFDGVLFRIYYDGETGTWAASTNGQIKAKNGWGGRAFDDLIHDPAVQACLDYSLLNPAYCYYVVLEHPEHINIVPHFKARLILVDAVTISQPFTPVPIADIEGFAHVQIRQALAQMYVQFNGPALFELAEHYKIGIVVNLTSGRRVRIESANFKYLSSLRPNVADVYKQWIHKLHRPSYGWSIPDLLTESERDIVEYLKYFTWHTEKFNYMRQRFLEIYTALCQKITERKVIIPKRLMKFYRELTPEEQMPEMVLRKLIDADEKHLFYLMNPYNVADENRDPQVKTKGLGL